MWIKQLDSLLFIGEKIYELKETKFVLFFLIFIFLLIGRQNNMHKMAGILSTQFKRAK